MLIVGGSFTYVYLMSSAALIITVFLFFAARSCLLVSRRSGFQPRFRIRGWKPLLRRAWEERGKMALTPFRLPIFCHAWR